MSRNDLAPSGRAQSNESKEQQEASGSERAVRVWQALTQMFGAAFPAAYGETPPTIWIRSIEGMTDEHVAKGLRSLAKVKRGYPPNLTEFVEACGWNSQRTYLGRTALPAPEFSRWSRSANMRMMRIVLREGGVGKPAIERMCAAKAMLVIEFEKLEREEPDDPPDIKAFVKEVDEALELARNNTGEQ